MIEEIAEKQASARLSARFQELWGKVHTLSQENMLLRDRVQALEKALKQAEKEKEALKKALFALKKNYFRSFVFLAVAVGVVVLSFFTYLNFKISQIEKKVLVQVKSAFQEETEVGLTLKTLYPELYQAILENQR